MKVISEARRAH